MGLEYPQYLLLLLLAVPFYKYVRVPGNRFHSGLRVLLIVLAVLYLSRPYVDLAVEGVDVTVIVDRSASIDDGAAGDRDELLRLIGASSGRDGKDRVSIIGFGREAAVEIAATSQLVSAVGGRIVNRDGSNLAEALKLASAARSPLRRTRLMVLSDGLYTGRNPMDADVVSALQGLPVWFRRIGKRRTGDIAAESLTLPQEVPPGAGFRLKFSLYSDTEANAFYSLKRDGKVVAAGETFLKKGSNRFFARDLVPKEQRGMVHYRLEVKGVPPKEGEAAVADAVPANNVYTALIRVVSPPRVLHFSGYPRGGLVVQALNKAGIPTDSFNAAETASITLTPAFLAPYKVVVLENIPMEVLKNRNARVLAEAVRSGVVSLVVSGGWNAFGNGGYHKSPLDPLLPVSMEIKEEQKRGVLALVVVMDRSGSMAAQVAGGLTKMQLANMGVAESIRFLSPLDQISVIAVDSQPHVIVPMVQADDTSQLVKTVLSIESMGGGIFVRTALEAAAMEARKSSLFNRHIILFSDARDSEEQKDSVDFVGQLKKEGISVGVIGLGSPGDSDALFLEEVAKAGGGGIVFTEQVGELPQIFSREVIRVSRRGFVEENVSVDVLPDILRLRLPADFQFPRLGGYNLSSLRKGASCAAVTADEYKSPIIAFHRLGKSSVVTLMAEIEGKHGISKWARAGEVVVNCLRLAAGGVNLSESKAYSFFHRGEARVEIQCDQETAERLRMKTGGVESPGAVVRFLAPHGGPGPEGELEWETSTTAFARVPLMETGDYLPVVDLGEKGIIKAPPVSVPYSPEFLPGNTIDGQDVLEALARTSGGREMVKADELFSPEGLSAVQSRRDIGTWILVLFLVLLLLEIAEKRLTISRLLK
ncbi:MAG: VWA domain-containing protein [bacterium]|nr:VWA domain-containing protein [bacterium]